ncbi:hypothetical protein H920_16226 [Fukomys damarensis]|uniref:Uncharacterized protein n=1 Tax=Fukomys damarensis TaxID=885580 RepID=A0A091CV44_FUKDA|nr:hypothetical protein H920_16226 [Fukomys damarensis]
MMLFRYSNIPPVKTVALGIQQSRQAYLIIPAPPGDVQTAHHCVRAREEREAGLPQDLEAAPMGPVCSGQRAETQLKKEMLEKKPSLYT